jgi:hypothetical protein
MDGTMTTRTAMKNSSHHTATSEFLGTILSCASLDTCDTRDTPLIDNRSGMSFKYGQKRVLTYLSKPFTTNVVNETEEERNDGEVECVLDYESVVFNQSLANDCIIPDRTSISPLRDRPSIEQAPRAKAHAKAKPRDDLSVISQWSKISAFKPLFDADDSSVVSGVSNITDMIDDPFQAAERGDLEALQSFHSNSRTDWSMVDKFQNPPLYYACQSGAIEDIKTVAFLLEVTPNKSLRLLERCLSNASTQEVVKLLSRFMMKTQSDMHDLNVKQAANARDNAMSSSDSDTGNEAVEGSGQNKVSSVNVVTSFPKIEYF